MKITKVSYSEEHANFVIDAYPGVTFRIPLTGISTRAEIVALLRAKVTAYAAINANLTLYNSLQVSDLEGSDL